MQTLKFSTTFDARLDQLASVREFVLKVLEKGEIVHLVGKDEMQLMVHEAFSNIVRHGQSKNPISLKAEIQKEGISFCMVDQGVGFDPTLVPYPDFSGEKEGGFGCYIIGKIADKIHYQKRDEGNYLTLFKSFGEKHGTNT